MFKIDERLQADSHALFQHHGCHLRLHKNATLPWVIIIPETSEIEFCDLSTENQLAITHISGLISGYFKARLNIEKINFAAIGNVVQQLHIHVVGRHAKDPLWPDVVWGSPLPEARYTDPELTHWREALGSLFKTET